ncbi:MAG: peptide ABC transporter substrate-binding protein [Gammaproteobacteria bacterium]
MPKTIVFRLLLLIASSQFGACSLDAGTNVETGTRDSILHAGNGTEPQDLDPHVVTGITEHNIIIALNEGLVSKHPEDLSIRPGVAEAWRLAGDGVTYTFTLRENARWSNGEPLTATDFVGSWRRALLPGLANAYAYMLYPLKNAEAFNRGEITDFEQVGVKAADARTLVVQLHRPVPYFLQLLDHYSYFPVPVAVIRQHGALDERGARWTRPGNHVGNGPYKLSEWLMNRIIIVDKNPYYWDADKVTINTIKFYPIDNTTTEEHMFRAGQLHLTNTIPIGKMQAYQQSQDPALRVDPYLGTYYYALNTTVPALRDARVRRALAISIDRESIVRKITRGGQLSAYNFTPPDTNGYTARARMEYNIDRARRLLAEAGFPDGEGFPELTITYNTSDGHRKIAIAIQEMWKQALNIKVGLLNQEWKVYLDTTKGMNHQIARAAWIGDYFDPGTFLDLFITDGGNNITGWSNAEYDALIQTAADTPDQAERYEHFQRAEAILMAEAPVIPIYTYTRQMLMSPDVKGYYTNILDYRSYKDMSLEENDPTP